MSLVLAPQYTQRNYRWTQWKAVYAIKGSPFQYVDEENLYTLWTYDGPEVHICQIWKSSVPDSLTTIYSQETNDSDKTDFETNFKALGNLPLAQLDTDGASIVRVKAAKKGWSFWAVPIELTTSVIGGSIFCQDRNGTDISGITVKLLNASNAEVTVPGLLNINLSTVTQTIIDFEPNFDYEIIGGELRINSNPATDCRMWIIGAPDIPAQYGGSKEFTSGLNLKFMSADSPLMIDGRVTKFITYNATNHQGKLRILLKHTAGAQVNMQFVIHMYRL